MVSMRTSTEKRPEHILLVVEGESATRNVLSGFLAGRGYRVAPFTIENSDWLFSSVYGKAQKSGDEALAAKVREAYLAHSEAMLDWFETLAKAERSHANRFQKALDTLGK